MINPVVIVSGASRGLGSEIAWQLAKLGARVVLNARTNRDLLKTQKKIRDAGGMATSIPGDITIYQTSEKIVAEAVRVYGRIDAVVNNVGNIEPIASIAVGHIEDWETNFAVNVFGHVKLIQASLPYLRKKNGRIINITSGAAVTLTWGLAAYSSAKAAITHFTKILAIEEPEIIAIALRPGSVNTSMQKTIIDKGKSCMPESVYKKFTNQYFLGKLLPPELPAKAIAILALYAPQEWSGEFLQWDEEKIRILVDEH
jgi:NAD(P)-dependent dehydrogenase (short-subunit alcohol dehydrogenase family)